MFYQFIEIGDSNPMSAAAKHPFFGQKVAFGTKHGKAEILAPILGELGMICEAIEIDTDIFGTFAGEIERVGGVRETLRKKLQAALKKAPHFNLFLASEGSFGSHPFLGFGNTDLESLLLGSKGPDDHFDFEIYAEHLDERPLNIQGSFGPRDDLNAILQKAAFPEHGLIVYPEGEMNGVIKGIHDRRALEQAILESLAFSKNGRVSIGSDLRANHNPTRREAIRSAALKLLEKLKSLCPFCETPGFAISHGNPGLPCEVCLEPSRAAKEVVWACVKCGHEEIRPRPDGKKKIDSSECEFCNP